MEHSSGYSTEEEWRSDAHHRPWRSEVSTISIRWRDEPDTRFVWVVGEVDLVSVTDLRQALSCAQSHLTVDMTGVSFIDLIGLRCLLDAAAEHKSVTLVSSPRVDRLLELTATGHTFHRA